MPQTGARYVAMTRPLLASLPSQGHRRDVQGSSFTRFVSTSLMIGFAFVEGPSGRTDMIVVAGRDRIICGGFLAQKIASKRKIPNELALGMWRAFMQTRLLVLIQRPNSWDLGR
jgi:hypothetical protein